LFIIEESPYSDRQESPGSFIQLAITACRVRSVTIARSYINAA
jgi:hypothetical protein